MGKIKKLIASMLVVTFIATSTPLQVFAQEVNTQANNAQDTKTETKEDGQSPKKILDELKEKREANIKHFLIEDKTYEAVVYNKPVHYMENGQWKDIDNTLVENTDEEFFNDELINSQQNQVNSTVENQVIESNKDDINNVFQKSDNKTLKNQKEKNVLQNTANGFKINIAKKTDSKKLVKISKDKYEISWGIQNAQKSTSEIVQPDDNKLNDLIEKIATDQINKNSKLKDETEQEKNKEKQIIIENEKKKTVSKVSSSVIYNNIYPDIDLNYSIISDTVKENLIINKKTDNNVFNYNIEVKNLIAVKQKDNSIIFYDQGDKTKAVFAIKAPYMFDSNGNESSNIEVKFEETNEGYTLSMIPSKEWLNASDRVYPVTVDPDVITDLSSVNIIDTFVCSGDTANKALNQYLRVGNNSGVGTTRSFIKFNLPQLTSEEMVIGAQLNMVINNAPVANQINAHKVLSNWNADAYNNLGWSNKPTYNSEIEDYNIVSGSGTWASWDVTSIAKEWYSSGNNFGLMLKSDNENTSDSIFWSSDVDNTYAQYRPQVSIKYVNYSGLEDYWTYHSQNVGRAGTGYVNDYNGNLIFSNNDISMNGNKMPVSIIHTYNNNFKGPIDPNNPNYSYGYGWRLNLNQRVYSERIQGTDFYVYIDGDGTKHYLKYDSTTSTWKDELGLDITLTVNGSTTGNDYFIIKDKKDNKLTFYSGGNLNQIIDNNDNKLTIGYTGPKITSVTDGAGRVTTLDVDANGYLRNIIYPKGETDPIVRKISYDYTGNQLTKITYPDGKYVSYNYYPDGNLKEVIDIEGYKISYDYTSGSVKRVSKISEFYKDGSTGQTLDLKYGSNITTFVDSQNRKNIYQFNNQGNTVCITEPDGSASYYEYGKDTNKSKMTLSSKMQKSVMNYVINHNVEDDSESWYPSNVSGSTGTIGYENTISYYGNRSIKIEKTNTTSVSVMQQALNLEKGKTYTLSGYIRTENISNINNGGASLYINYRDSNGNLVELTSKKIIGTSDWNRYETSITIPSDATTDQVYFGAMISNETGIGYFDGFQLEEGKIANRYNLVENPNFILNKSSTARFWTAENLNYYDGVVANNDNNYPIGLDNSKITYRLDGYANRIKTISQTIKQQGKKGDIFVAAAWAKAHSVPNYGQGRYFGIDVRIVRKDGSIQYCYFPFNEDSTEWQYKSGKFITDSDYSEIRILELYCNNSNTAYFDGVQLYKEEFGQSYQYDSKGNIISTADLNQKNSQFQYDEKNDLRKAVDPKGSTFDYQYYDSHNLKQATTAENIVYCFTYDPNKYGYGNLTELKVRNSDDTVKMVTSAEYDDKGNYIKSLTDSSGNTTSFNYEEYKGTLKNSTDANGKTTAFGYNPYTDALESTTKNVDINIPVSNGYSYENDRIKTITHNAPDNNVVYTFDYDNMGYNNSVSVGNKNLITNQYEPKSRNLLKSLYGNGQNINFSYDELDRLKGKKYDSDTIDRFTYSYDEAGNLGYKYDSINHLGLRYIYDVANRLSQVNSSDGSVTKYNYDSNNNLSSFTESLEGYKYTNISNFKTVTTISNQDAINYAPGNVTDSNSLTRWASGNDSTAYLEIDLGNKFKINRVELNWEVAFAKGYEIQVYNSQTGNWDVVYTETNGNGGIDDIKNLNVEGQKIRLYAYLRGTQYNYSLFDFNVYTLKTDVNSTFNRYLDKSQSSKISKGMPVVASSTQSGSTFYPSNINDDNLSTRWSSGNIDDSWVYIDLGDSKNIDRVVLNWETAFAQGYEIQVSNDLINWATVYIESNGNGGIDDIRNLNGKGRYVKMKANKRGTPYYYSLWEFEVYSTNNINTFYEYDKDNKLTKTITNSGGYVNNIYDSIGRLDTSSINSKFIKKYNYKVGINKDSNTTNKISKITFGTNGTSGTNEILNVTNVIDYDYDKNGNIEKITQGGKVIDYKYNELNELVRENNEILDKTIIYTYDVGGNITNKKEYAYTTLDITIQTIISDINYCYTDANWKDKLTTYNGNPITYETFNTDIGNPISYSSKEGQSEFNWNLTWEAGRQLKEIKKSTQANQVLQTINYQYNDSGIRTKKTVEKVATYYHLVGDKVTYEETVSGTEVTSIYYTYDASGKLVSMILTDKDNNGKLVSNEYFYIRNAQSDIIGLIDKTGTQVVSYTYDSWGKLISIKDGTGVDITNNTASVGYKNPYRYRGYRYDTETGLYYLQSRYYNPEWGRFINADGLIGRAGELIEHNMFAYCLNNPISKYDPDGCATSDIFFEQTIIKTIITTIAFSIASTAFLIDNIKTVIKPIKNSTKNNEKNTKIKIREDKAGHIFDKNKVEKGHFGEDTPENRKEIEDVANDKNNYLGRDARGNDWYGKIRDDGKQVWGQVRDGEIRDAGINKVPRTWDPNSGLSSPTKPGVK